MKCFEKWRGFCNSSSQIALIRKFYHSNGYLALVAMLTFVGYYFGCELYMAFGIFTLCALALAVDYDARSGIPTLLFFIFCLPLKHVITPSSPLENYYAQHLNLVYGLAIFALLMIALRFVLWGGFTPIFTKPTKLLFFALPLVVALLLGGAGAKGWQWQDLAFGALTAFCWVGIYLVFVHNLTFDDTLVAYFCKCCFWVAMLLIAEQIYVYLINDVIVDGVVYKYKFDLGWGAQNAFGAIISMLIPPCFYLAKTQRFGLVYYFGGVLTYLSTMMCMSRGAMVFGTLVMVVSGLALCLYGKKKMFFYLVNVTTLLVGGLLFLTFFNDIMTLFDFVGDYGFNDNGRYQLWGIFFDENGKLCLTGGGAIQVFKEHLFFGCGFWQCAQKVVEALPGLPAFTPMPAMFHNTVCQLIAATGVVGIVTYVVYRARTVQMMVWRMTERRFFLGLMILCLLGTSLLDNHIFYVYDAFFYSVGLAIIELDYRNKLQSKKQKPQLLESIKK